MSPKMMNQTKAMANKGTAVNATDCKQKFSKKNQIKFEENTKKDVDKKNTQELLNSRDPIN